jgi:predicted membrane-bound mannosyltransferase
MYATKETSVIAFGAIAAGLLFAHLKPQTRQSSSRAGKMRPRVRWTHLALGIGSAVLVSFLFFSSFLQNPNGFLDSLLSFKVYFVRAGEGGFHVHPWFAYLRMLAFFRAGSGPLWSEGFILLLAVIGGVTAFGRRHSHPGHPLFSRFILFYTLFSTAIYSLIPYKTPWNILPFYIGFILLAGMGASFLLDACRNRLFRTALLVLLTAGFLHLGAQAYRGSFIEPANPADPYVYAQTTPDFLKLVHRVEDLAAIHPDGDRMLIKVIASPYETWPLPWYLRRFARVGYWTDADTAGGAGEADVIISDTEQAERLEPSLDESFLSELYGLRPNVFLVLHIRSDLWEKFLSSRPGKS